MAPVEFQLLGPPAIRVNGARIAGLPAKLEALLFFTAVAPRTVSRSTLAGLLWPDRNEQEARMNLRAALAKLPAALEPAVTVTRDWVALEAADLEVDVRRFDAVALTLGAGLAAPERLVKLCDGLAAYRGEFLADFRVGQAPEFEVWREGERARLRQGAVRLATDILALQREAGLHADAAQTARRILQLAPGHDAALRALMEALERAGQRNAAVEEFERHRKLWHEELGISPAAETVRTAERILAGEAAAPAAPSAPAPATLQVFGRDAEFALISKLLEPGEARIVSITGMGGVGKTRLAQALLTELKPRFAHGAVLVSTGAMRSGANLAPALAKAFQLQARGPDPVPTIKDYLREKHMLVVVDSFEGLIGTEAVDLLLQLAQEAPGLRLLVTSRESLGLEEEAVVPLEGLAYPTESSPGWRDFPAVQLFIQRASRGYVRFDAERERDGIVALCRGLQGIPLAIELAASLARNMPCVEIARAVENDLRSLAKDDAALSPRHRSLMGMLETAYGQLPPELQEGIARLSIFRGPLRADSALEVAGCSLRQLSALIEKSWLRRDPVVGYLLHDVVRQFAASRLGTLRIPLSELRARHGLHFAKMLASRVEPIRRGTGQGMEAELWYLIADLLDASHWIFAEGDMALAAPAMEALYGLHEIAGDDLSLMLIFREVVERLANSPHERRALFARANCYLAWSYSQMARLDEATPAFDRALTLARDCGDAEVLSATLRGMGVVCSHRGQCAEGMRILEECMAITRTLGSPTKEMNTLNVMGLLASGLGDMRGAREGFERVLELARQHDYPRGEVVARINLGESLQSAGELEASRAHFEAALAVLERAPSRRAHLMCLLNLGQIAQLHRDADASRKYLAETERNIREGGERRYGSFVHQARAEIAAMEGDAAGIEAAGRDMAATADSIGFVWAGAFGPAYVAQARVALGDRDGALEQVRDLHRRTASADLEIHQASFALEAARWTLAFGSDAAARKQASACVSWLAASKSADFWAVKRAQELAAAHALSGDQVAKGDSREWMVTMEALLPRATIAA